MKAGQDARVDGEYVRHGVVNILMANEPLVGKRYVQLTEFKTKRDWLNLKKESLMLIRYMQKKIERKKNAKQYACEEGKKKFIMI